MNIVLKNRSEYEADAPATHVIVRAALPTPEWWGIPYIRSRSSPCAWLFRVPKDSKHTRKAVPVAVNFSWTT